MTDNGKTKKSNSPAAKAPPVVAERDEGAPEEQPVVKARKPSFMKKKKEVPEYLRAVYGTRYFQPVFAMCFDSGWLAEPATFFYSKKLTKAVTDEIIEGDDVLQLGLGSGGFERAVSDKMNGKGKYVIEDLSSSHAAAAEVRISPWLNAAIRERDFTVADEKRYDVVVGWFALHELPDERKKAALKRACDSLKPDGKLIFIDYAKPKKFHPFGWFVKMFNRLFEPFAESLWYNEIESFAPVSDNMIWAKKTYFGGMYQCVIAQKR